jgi:hypothetical protein
VQFVGHRCIKLPLIFKTSGFWPRVRARALRSPVFLGSLPRQTGRYAPLISAHRSFAASYLTPKNLFYLLNLGRPRQGLFSFHRTTEAMKCEVHLPPAPPIAASLILPAIIWGSKLCTNATIRPNFLFVFLFYSFWIFFFLFSSLSSLLFNFFLFFTFLFFSSYNLNCLLY